MSRPWYGWLTLLALTCALTIGALSPTSAHAQDGPSPAPASTPDAAPAAAAQQPGAPGAEPSQPAPAANQAAASADAAGSVSSPAAPEPAHEAGHKAPSPLWIIPFVLLLGAIATGPLINQHWWEHNYPYVAIGLGTITAVYYLFFHGDAHPWYHAIIEYASFIALLASLYVVSGGIVIQVGARATPAANTMLLFIGAVLSNFVGTTGASMLLIRPFLRMNKDHIKPFHVVFFIFIVSNVGGSLTPIGDPPLFLGYLQGIPFFWTLTHLWPLWAVIVGVLLVVFYAIDTLDGKKNPRQPHANDPGPKVSIVGFPNMVLIGVILIGVFRPSFFEIIAEFKNTGHTIAGYASLLISREVLMIGAGVGSLIVTPKIIHERNQFTWGPIKEVAIIFIGIFSTMVPALGWLSENADKMPLKTPGQYYFTTGSLSAVLDNAPTYLVFLSTRLGMLDQAHVDMAMTACQEMAQAKTLTFNDANMPVEVKAAVTEMVVDHSGHILSGNITRREVELAFLLGNPALNAFILAVSAGAVFFGAATYIGNGPNFMVKSIAESSGVHMPSFFGYIVRFTLPFLLPTLILIWLIFFVILG